MHGCVDPRLEAVMFTSERVAVAVAWCLCLHNALFALIKRGFEQPRPLF